MANELGKVELFISARKKCGFSDSFEGNIALAKKVIARGNAEAMQNVIRAVIGAVDERELAQIHEELTQ